MNSNRVVPEIESLSQIFSSIFINVIIYFNKKKFVINYQQRSLCLLQTNTNNHQIKLMDVEHKTFSRTIKTKPDEQSKVKSLFIFALRAFSSFCLSRLTSFVLFLFKPVLFAFQSQISISISISSVQQNSTVDSLLSGQGKISQLKQEEKQKDFIKTNFLKIATN